MTETIGYDKSITNLIRETTDFCRVIHEKHKKKSVTLHGSGSNLTHAGVLDVWRSRGISMQFAVNVNGDIAQYVAVDEFACAVGPAKGNEESIHIELVNRTPLPSLEISVDTLKSTARLIGWLFVYEINDHPARDLIHTHDYWSPMISCPGEYFDANYYAFLEEVQGWYTYFRNQQHEAATFSLDETVPDVVSEIRMIQKAIGVSVTGRWDVDTDQAILEFRRRQIGR